MSKPNAGINVSASGSDGAAGAPGVDGNTILYGTAAPTTEGVDGNFYIRTTTNMLYGPKASGVWPAGTSIVGPAGSDAVATEVTVSALSLGSQSASQSTFTVYTVPTVAARGIVTRMTITADGAGLFDCEVRADASNGTLLYQAIDVTTTSLDMSFPFSYKAASGNSFYIYIKNKYASSRSFVLTTLTVEKFA
jgi:hypothetical protein